jgi:curved DNA-binding protein CbpA
MAAVRDYYRVLGVPRSATAAEIKAAFRKKAQLFHPDHNPGKEEWANKRLKSLVEAYEVLNDPVKRRHLDHQLALKRRTTVRRVSREQQERAPREEPEVVIDLVRRRAAQGWRLVISFSYGFIEYYYTIARK